VQQRRAAGDTGQARNPRPPQEEGSTKPLPDWTKVHEELKRRGVTLMILWEEHRAAYVDGHGYSRYVAPGFMLRNWVRAASCAMIGVIDAT
jgi:transposase